jgi:uncharacterized DUF497 family protein
VDIDFNPAKEIANVRKHGVSLSLANRFDWLTGHVQPARTVDGEARWKLIVRHEGIVYAAIFTRRADVLWIISVRRASRKERREYAR